MSARQAADLRRPAASAWARPVSAQRRALTSSPVPVGDQGRLVAGPPGRPRRAAARSTSSALVGAARAGERCAPAARARRGTRSGRWRRSTRHQPAPATARGLGGALGGQQVGHVGLERVDLLLGEARPRRARRADPAEMDLVAGLRERRRERAARRRAARPGGRGRGAGDDACARWVIGGADGRSGERARGAPPTAATQRRLVAGRGGGGRDAATAAPRRSRVLDAHDAPRRRARRPAGRGSAGPEAEQRQRAEVRLARRGAGGAVGGVDTGGSSTPGSACATLARRPSASRSTRGSSAHGAPHGGRGVARAGDAAARERGAQLVARRGAGGEEGRARSRRCAPCG